MFCFCLLVFVLGSSALSLRHDIELSPREREVQAGRQPLGGIRSHLIFGSCMLEGERCGWEGSPALWDARVDLRMCPAWVCFPFSVTCASKSSYSISWAVYIVSTSLIQACFNLLQLCFLNISLKCFYSHFTSLSMWAKPDNVTQHMLLIE